MAFDRGDIERVRDAADIVELARAVTTVKKSGRTVKAICPFHQEKTPSMSLDPARGLFHCFGCGKGGDVYKFVQESQAVDFGEAVEILARQAGITLTRDPRAAARHGRRREIVEALEAAVDFYHQRLKQSPDAAGARSYLRGRGYDGDVVDTFKIGYAPEERGWNALITELKGRGVSEKTLVDAGLATRTSKGRLRDWFHNRLLFPIHDLKGDAVGFGARILDGDGPKYLNSPETEVYRKARLLYGLDRAKSRISRDNLAVIVEGYTDVIALHLAGYDLAVATCGTALGEEHFDLLRRFTDRIVLAFDADQAGAGAALRGGGLQTPSDLGLDLRVAIMPEGRDPADLVQAGDMELLRSAIDASQPFLRFEVDRILAGHALDEIEGRTRALREAAQAIARLDDEVARHEYGRALSRQVGVEVDEAIGAIESARKRPRERTEPAPRRSEAQRPRPTGEVRAEREAVRLAIAGHMAGKGLTTEHFSDPTHRRAFEILLEHGAGDGPVDLAVVADANPRAAEYMRVLLLDDRPEEDADALVSRLEQARVDRRVDELRRALEAMEPTDERYGALSEELVAALRRRDS
ncbi:MAG: DNA primase [Acidimicrobiia bacterium]|nr:MAG: DNA primase [Acidimicrobiia bacterium]